MDRRGEELFGGGLLVAELFRDAIALGEQAADLFAKLLLRPPGSQHRKRDQLGANIVFALVGVFRLGHCFAVVLP